MHLSGCAGSLPQHAGSLSCGRPRRVSNANPMSLQRLLLLNEQQTRGFLNTRPGLDSCRGSRCTTLLIQHNRGHSQAKPAGGYSAPSLQGPPGLLGRGGFGTVHAKLDGNDSDPCFSVLWKTLPSQTPSRMAPFSLSLDGGW